MGPIAKPCKWARPQRCQGVGQQRLSGLESAVELRLGENKRMHSFDKKALASFKISLARRNSRFSRSKALSCSRSTLVTPARTPESTSAFFTHSSKVGGTQPTLGAMDLMAAQRDGYSPRCCCTMRTARSRISGEKRFDFLFMAPSSQSLEPPQIPGRFT